MQENIYKFPGFETLEEFIRKHIGVEVSAANILIKYIGDVPKLPISNTLSISEMLSISLEQSEDGNQLCQGYCKITKQWSSLNTSRNLLKSKKWAEIFRRIGSEYSLLILKNGCIIQDISQSMLLLCGSITDLISGSQEKKKDEKRMQRELLFRGRPNTLNATVEESIRMVMNGVEMSFANTQIIHRKIENAVLKYQKLPLKGIFKSFVIEKQKKTSQGGLNEEDDTNIMEDQVDPKIIADFLFLISKKCFRPIFDLRSFKILNGKIVLLLKRNMLETLNMEDLSNHFSTTKFKLFAGCSGLQHPVRILLIKNLMMFLFNFIYLKILGYFFYSTVTSFSRLKVYYFTRVTWNCKVGKFFQKHLKTFRPCAKTNVVATLRCIPKETGFRVVTNCSKLGTHWTKNQAKPRESKSHKQPEYPSLLSIEKLASMYQDIEEILKDEYSTFQKPYNNGLENVRADTGEKRRFNTSFVNSQVSSIAPIMKKVAGQIPGFSLSRHFHVGRKLFPFIRAHPRQMILVKVDLKRCFENIPHAELMSFIENILSDDGYYFRELCILKANRLENRIDVRYFKDSPDVLYPISMVEARPSEVCRIKEPEMHILKENRSRIITKLEILRKITTLIKDTAVCYQNKYYSSTRGIPQGCSISSFLCSIYFSILDQRFPNFDWLVARFVDDFLIVTENPDHIKKFFELANSLKSMGFEINPKKISSNFDLSCLEDGHQEKDKKFLSNYIEWCGIRIYDRGIGMKSVCKDEYFRYAVFIPACRRGTKFFDKIKKSLHIKLSPIFINRQNQKLGECIFDALFYCGRRLRIGMLRMGFINNKFVEIVLRWCVDRTKAILDSRGILFDSRKVDNMACLAYKKCGVRRIEQKRLSF